MALTQKEAVVQAVMEVLGSDFSSDISVSDQLTKEQTTQVKETIFSQIQAGDVSFNKDVDETTLKRYVSGMVSNHCRKAKELNGGAKYSPKTTGRGSRDPQLSAMNLLLKQVTETDGEESDNYTKVFTAISARRTELADERALLAKERRKVTQAKKIDMSALPSDLHDLASNVIS